MNNIPEACQAVDRVVDDYLNDYEYDDGESCCHAPNETEDVLIRDAIAGLLADEKFVAAFVDWRLLVETGQTLADVKRVMANSEALARTVLAERSNAGLDSAFQQAVHHAYAQTDGTYAWPNSREGDMLREARREIEQLRAALQLSTNGLRHCSRWNISEETEKAIMTQVIANEALLTSNEQN